MSIRITATNKYLDTAITRRIDSGAASMAVALNRSAIARIRLILQDMFWNRDWIGLKEIEPILEIGGGLVMHLIIQLFNLNGEFMKIKAKPCHFYSFAHKSLIVLFAAVTMITMPVGPSYASTATTGTINTILALPGGIITFNHTGVRTPLASCQTANLPTRWAFNASTPAGQVWLSVLLSAYALGKRVTVQGTGNCTDWGDTESVLLIQVDD